MIYESTPASAQRPVLPSAAMVGSIREISGHRIAHADRRGWVERWVIAPAALADRGRLLDCCRSLC
eukprot:6756930-Prymnesium_polylepis.1